MERVLEHRPAAPVARSALLWRSMDSGAIASTPTSVPVPAAFGHSFATMRLLADSTPMVVQRNGSVHPEEQHCEDVSNDATSGCAAVVECIEDLIEALAGRFHQLQPGDTGHEQRIEIVQAILRRLMGMAAVLCEAGEYDSELQEEADKWANKRVQTAPAPAGGSGQRQEDIEQQIYDALPYALAIVVIGLIAACIIAEPCGVAVVGALAAVLEAEQLALVLGILSASGVQTATQ